MNVLRPSTQNNQHSPGFALVVVILVLLLVTVLAAELTFAVRIGTLEGFNTRQRLVGRALAHGGINQALFGLFDTPVNYDDDQRPYLGKELESRLAPGRIHYVLVNESGKIDLNGASRQLLATVAEFLGMDEEEQEILVDSLGDWRDADNLHRLQGAEDDYYQDLEPPYRARNGKCIEVSELALVRGAEKIADLIKISEIFTVHNPSGMVNFNSLSPAMLAFLTDNDPAKMIAYHELRQNQGDLSALEAQLILGDERYQQCKDFLTYTDNKVAFFTVTATGYAGSQDADQDEGDEDRPGTRVTVLFEKKGLNLNYYGWQEEWS
ncbi:MAG: general secretion pathway protein GspK [Proteobacteria bacterium]|nr:general secretion pathway protein GspK [Pseudomonadota bacterium]MBU1639619.1 general secretion pathway protein GspK [Pseudomonadota bacterium]